MTTELDDRPMAKRNDSPVKIDTEVLANARIVAACKGMSLAEFLSETLRPILAQQLEEQLTQRVKGAGKPKGGK